MLLLFQIRFLDVLDIVLVATLLYALYQLLRGSSALNILLGFMAIYLLWRLVHALNMVLLSQILGGFIGAGMIALLVVFQPEIRKFLLLLGEQTSSFGGKRLKWRIFENQYHNDNQLNIDAVVKSCMRFSKENTGALIVLSRNNNLHEVILSGTEIKAEISDQLIENIFFKNSPLHDGAVVISENKIEAAGCILPLTESRNIDKELGLRHRAALGLTEKTDALCIVVSEETGYISFVQAGVINRDISPADLQNSILSALDIDS